MEREEAEAIARRELTTKKVTHLLLALPVTWGTIFLFWVMFFGILLFPSEQRVAYAFDLVVYTGIFLATVLTPLLSLDPILGSLHDIVSYRNMQHHIAKMDLMSRRRGG